MNYFGIKRAIDTVGSQTVFSVNGFPVNNSTLSVIIILLFVLFSYFVFIKKFYIQPGKGQLLVEIVFEEINNFLFQITSSRKKTDDLLPIIGSVFVFVLLSNFIAVVPILGSFIYDGKAIFRAPTSDFNTTFSLALGSLIIIQLSSIKHHGFFGYLGRFFKFKEVYIGFKKGIYDGFISMVDFFIGLLDIVSEFARTFSLSIRLFGNIYAAGMVLATVMTGIVAYALPAVFTGLGLFFGAVQAVVFSALITSYYIMSLPESSPEEISHSGENF